ncbi:MAG: hypothetical protein SO165_02870 [Lachnospiraceae bacterium]|nr:hypothetical protein [Lachnospiraceae bacterium]
MLIFIAMFILYGIQGAYQPAVQASIPALLPMEYIMQGNALINLVSCFFMMLLASLFSIQIMSYLQIIVPGHLIGKSISCAMCIGMCATPIGQAVYGVLFEKLNGSVYVLFYIVTVLVVILSFMLKKPFLGLSKLIENKEEELNH